MTARPKRLALWALTALLGLGCATQKLEEIVEAPAVDPEQALLRPCGDQKNFVWKRLPAGRGVPRIEYCGFRCEPDERYDSGQERCVRMCDGQTAIVVQRIRWTTKGWSIKEQRHRVSSVPLELPVARLATDERLMVGWADFMIDLKLEFIKGGQPKTRLNVPMWNLTGAEALGGPMDVFVTVDRVYGNPRCPAHNRAPTRCELLRAHGLDTTETRTCSLMGF